MTKHTINRRRLLQGITAGGLSAALAPVMAADRPVTTSNRQLSLCINDQVPSSSLSQRFATLADFNQGVGACQLSRDSVEGPYFICTNALSGKDITAGLPGHPLTVALRVLDSQCRPVPNAVVDIWSCDASGNYSGHDVDPDDASPPPRGRREADLPSRFLRGVLAVDKDSIVEFDTIYPGYYAGRPVHIHFKVHVDGQNSLTSQALFPESLNSRILATAPYNQPRGTERVLNEDDIPFIGGAGLFEIVERDNKLLALMNLIVEL